jgi:uncharacterized membrane protein
LSERRQILTLVGITLIIGVAAVTLIGILPSSAGGGDAVVEEYSATFYPDGRLEEKYTYTISERRFRFLFRVWEAPLTWEPSDSPYIEPLEIVPAPGAVGYFKDNRGFVQVDEAHSGDRSIINAIDSLALENEVGSYNPSYYNPGSYVVRYLFDIHPSLEYDDDIGHLNLMLANDHIPYRRVVLTFEEAGYIERLYVRPPTFTVSEEGDRIVVEGRSGEDELIEVEMLIDLDALDTLGGFPQQVENVRTKTINANRVTNLQYSAALALGYGTRVIVLVMPLLLYAAYQIYGREKEYTVPRYLSFVPNAARKPWVVNQIFKGRALDYDDEGFYATILDLHLKKKIEITTKPGGLLIEILDDSVADAYERQVMTFLKILARNGVVDTDRIADYTEMIKSGDAPFGSTPMRLKGRLVYLTTHVDDRMASKFILRGRRRLYPLMALTFLVLIATITMVAITPFEIPALGGALLLSFVPLIQMAVAMVFPQELFGRWKGEGYREKLEWDAFRNHLSDLSQMRKYAPEDISMWGEWLVYGTALGVGDSVVRAMSELDINIPEATYIRRMPIFFHPFVVASQPSRTRGGKAFGGGRVGGRFGGGGGVGGGGAGVR